MNPDKLLTLLMGKYPWEETPSYSDPRHRDEFFTWLCRERGEMWKMFLSWALRQYEHPWAWEGKTIPWFFFSSPSRPRDLMAEWLRLDSTIRDFGWEECPNMETGCKSKCARFDCKDGKVLTAWAKYAKEGKEWIHIKQSMMQ